MRRCARCSRAAAPAETRRALGELRGAAVLQGARGIEAPDLDRVAQVVARIGEVTAGLGDRLESLEVNPLLARGAQPDERGVRLP